MTTITALLNHPLMGEFGWTLLHSLWQGALIGLIFLVLRLALRRQSASLRYLAGCACLALLPAASVLTFIHETTPAPGAEVVSYAVSGPVREVASLRNLDSLGTPFHGGGTGSPLAGGPDFLTRLASALVLGWLLGVLFFSARLTRSCWSVRGIRDRDNEPLDASWLEKLDELRCRLGVSQPVRLLKSAVVEVPTPRSGKVLFLARGEGGRGCGGGPSDRVRTALAHHRLIDGGSSATGLLEFSRPGVTRWGVV